MKTLHLALLTAFAILTAFPAIAGEALRELAYPDQVEHQISSYTALAERIFDDTSILKVGKPSVEVRHDGIYVDLVVTNPSAKAVTFAARGAALSYGGVTPLSLWFSPKTRKKLGYIGAPEPPAPPPPVVITAPARSRITFRQSLSLSKYAYSGTPTVKVNWDFQFIGGKEYGGTFTVKLSKKRLSKGEMPLPPGEAALVSDIDTLCRRVEMKRISAWSQPIYQTARWRDLTVRADNGETKAFCEMAELMKTYRSKLSCEDSFRKELQSRCEG